MSLLFPDEDRFLRWEHKVVGRLTDSPNSEGKWFMVRGDQSFRIGRLGRDGVMRPVDMVCTGCVEWDDNQCAEVYVPSDRLNVWRAEHQTD